MEWSVAAGILFLGAIPTFVALWGEGRWKPGAWQWLALAAGHAVVGTLLILWGVLDPTYEWTRSIGMFMVGYFLLGTGLAASVIWLFRSFSTEPERLKRMGREIVVLVLAFIFVPPVIIWVMEHLTDIWKIILCLLEPECVEFVINFD